MPQLTAINIAVLKNYATHGQRELYWNYLAQLGDPYAARALDVVRNNGNFGQMANNHAAAFVPDALKAQFTEAKWNDFGKTIIVDDFAARQKIYDTGLGDRGLTLTGEIIRTYHAKDFEAAGLPRTAWPMEPYLGKLYDSGDPAKIAEANQIWNESISSTVGYFKVVAQSPALLAGNAGVLAALATSFDNAALFLKYDQRNALQNPNFIRGWSYDAASGNWSRYTAPAGSPMGVLEQPSAADRQLLDADRQYRIDRLNDTRRFQPDPRDHLAPSNPRSLASLGDDPLNPNVHDLAVALGDMASADYWTAQAGSAGGQNATVPASVYASIETALANQDTGNPLDVTSAQTYKSGDITYVDFTNGNQIAIDATGRIATLKTEVSATGQVQTVQTHFDNSRLVFSTEPDGTRQVVSLDGEGRTTAVVSATPTEARVSEYANGALLHTTTTTLELDGTTLQVITAADGSRVTRLFDAGGAWNAGTFNGFDLLPVNSTSRFVVNPGLAKADAAMAIVPRGSRGMPRWNFLSDEEVAGTHAYTRLKFLREPALLISPAEHAGFSVMRSV